MSSAYRVMFAVILLWYIHTDGPILILICSPKGKFVNSQVQKEFKTLKYIAVNRMW